jgi:hypothetical protein
MPTLVDAMPVPVHAMALPVPTEVLHAMLAQGRLVTNLPEEDYPFFLLFPLPLVASTIDS